MQTVVPNAGQDHPVTWQSSQNHADVSTRCRCPTKKHLLQLFIKPMRHTHIDTTPQKEFFFFLFNFQAQLHLSLQAGFPYIRLHPNYLEEQIYELFSLIVIALIHVIHSPQHFFRVQQKSLNPSSDNPAFEDGSPKTMCFAFYQEKVSSLKQADLTNMFKKASKSVHTSTVVVSPDPLSPTLTSSPMKNP